MTDKKMLTVLTSAIILLNEQGFDKNSVCEETGITSEEYDELMKKNMMKGDI
jgi:hypothetical protein